MNAEAKARLSALRTQLGLPDPTVETAAGTAPQAETQPEPAPQPGTSPG
jgi:hypothetical protein